MLFAVPPATVRVDKTVEMSIFSRVMLSKSDHWMLSRIVVVVALFAQAYLSEAPLRTPV